MVSIHQLNKAPRLGWAQRLVCSLVMLVMIVGTAALTSSCAGERLAAREVLADPLMRFGPGRPIASPTALATQDDRPIPTDTVVIKVDTQADPGSDVSGLWISSLLRGSVEIFAGLGLEAAYGVELDRQRIYKIDGFAGPIDYESIRHGPDAAVVYDDGTSLLRVGYRFRTAWDGHLHEPSVLARTSVLSRDTTIELGYRRSMSTIEVGLSKTPADASQNLSEKRAADRITAAIEQGFVPGWNIRLEFSGLMESGYLQSPYRLVSLWSQRYIWEQTPDRGSPRVEAEQHPDSRMRWGGMFRVRKALRALSAVIEAGVGFGSGNWRVEHSTAELAYLQRMGDRLTLVFRGGAYHQIRATFYQDDYPDGPLGQYWSSDRELSSYMAYWGLASLQIALIPESGRVMGMFKYLNLELGGRLVRADYNFEGLSTQNGFTTYPSIASIGDRSSFDGGWMFGGWFGLVGGF